MLGLGMVAAAAVMAFVGASSAMAASTTLCKVNELPCAAGNQYLSGQAFAAKSTNALLDTSGTDVSCKKSTTSVKTAAQLAEPLKGEVTALTFEECTTVGSGFNCAVTTENLPYNASLAVEAGTMNGKLTVTKHTGGGSPGAAVSCAGGALKCVFSAEPVLKVVGGNPAEVVATAVKLTLTTKEGFLECPKEAKWSANYIATSPTSVFVAE
jgi:hypothetical protein